VKWTDIYEHSGHGKLIAINCGPLEDRHLVQRDDAPGWSLEPKDTSDTYRQVRAQGVKNGTNNLHWINSYELINEPMHLENIVAGTLVKSIANEYRRVLLVLGGEGELRSYLLSRYSWEKTSDNLKCASGVYTAFELQDEGVSIVDETQPEVVEVTIEEIAQMKGVDVSQIRVKE